MEITNKLDLGNVNYSGEISYTDLVIRICNLNRKNIENGKTEYFVHGVKAQYEHARIISTKLSVELGKEVKSWWEV